ncbi:MAG: hypothetical protein FWG96_02505 [Methanomassiliicoccaceae archaeon]|nr:hypothetical protein [Methanomassiliicoccaceae archaeon]
MSYAEKEKAIKALLSKAPFDLECNEEHMKLYKVAFTHDSYSNELERGGVKKDDEPYERLEFLGDAVVGLVASEYLYHLLQKPEEGEMSKEKEKIVGNEPIAKRLEEKRIDLFSLCTFSSGLEVSEKNRAGITSSVFEALIAAVYLNEGYDKAKGIAQKILIE